GVQTCALPILFGDDLHFEPKYGLEQTALTLHRPALERYVLNVGLDTKRVLDDRALNLLDTLRALDVERVRYAQDGSERAHLHARSPVQSHVLLVRSDWHPAAMVSRDLSHRLTLLERKPAQVDISQDVERVLVSRTHADMSADVVHDRRDL